MASAAEIPPKSSLTFKMDLETNPEHGGQFATVSVGDSQQIKVLPSIFQEALAFSSEDCVACATPNSYKMTGKLIDDNPPQKTMMNYVNHELYGINKKYLLTGNIVEDKLKLGSSSYDIDFFSILSSSPIF